EEIEVNESETPDENETESQNNSEEEEDTTKAGKTSKKMTMNQTNNIQPLNNGSFDINGTDTYASSSGGTFRRIYQLDGNDPTIIKGYISVTGIHSEVNNLNALGVADDGYLYVRGFTPGKTNNRIYRIDSDGNATLVGPTVGGTS